MASVKFEGGDSPFFRDLKSRVDAYFESTGQNTWGNRSIYIKSAILISLMVLCYGILIADILPVWAAILTCMVLGATLAAIGFNVMHDSAHGSFSDKPWLNNVMGYSLNVMGGDVHLWKTKHNLIHHSFTNIEHYDDDIEIQPVLRMNRLQPHYKAHRFQHWYAIIFYALNYLFWVYYFDYKKYFSGQIGVSKIKKYNFWDHFSFWATKVFYYSVFLVLPIVVLGWLPTLIGYAIITATCGIIIAVVFQLAHVVEETEFYKLTDEEPNIEVEWAIHQIKTTSNFATKSKIVHWFTGGLNHQVEHHLFPRISHVHYPAINRMVKETCEKFNIQYNEHRTVLQAVRSHFVHLKNIGAAA